MGFYGQVVYEFTKLFSKLMITQSNSEQDPVIPPIENQNIFLEADNMWEQIDIKPTNRWIQLDAQANNNSTKTIEIGHSNAGTAVGEKQTIGLLKINELPIVAEGEAPIEATPLASGDLLQTATTDYDAAGHLIENRPILSYYQLPIITISAGGDHINSADVDDQFYLCGDNHWVNVVAQENNDTGKTEFCFSHNIPENGDTGVTVDTIATFQPADGANATQLNYGDTFAVSNIIKDQMGHILSHSQTNYKLPISAGEEKFEEHDEAIAELESRLESGTVSLMNGGTSTYGTYENNINRLYSLGDVNQLFHGGVANDDLITYIGKIDGENGYSKDIALMLGTDSKNIYTVSDAFSSIANKVIALQNANELLTSAVNDLRKKVEALES